MRKTALVVDDNVLVRKLVCQLIAQERDFEVCGQAENGREAIEKAQELRPDLIVMDLSMPVMNGLDAARVIKKMVPTVRIVMYSQYSADFGKQEARSAGIAALVDKSEHVSSLIATARGLFVGTAA